MMLNQIKTDQFCTWKDSVDAWLGSAHTAEICAAIGRPVSASTTRASGQSTSTLMTDDLSCSVGLKMINDLKQRRQ